VLGVSDFPAAKAWYQQRLGLIVSDEIYAGDESNALGAFMRCNRGSEFVDHHTLFLLGGQAPGFNHAAFEIADWDSLMEGHYELQHAGYKHSWGIGKHLLGSQVFDYWRDPHDFLLEHFTDGDLMNESFGSHTAPIGKLLGAFWGPEGGPT
jgi:catechol 2,3-dioxygenase-like lactoylglutathione lyase family enzyme